jgi:hypothetical protein
MFRQGEAQATNSQICADFAAIKGIRGAQKLVRGVDGLRGPHGPTFSGPARPVHLYSPAHPGPFS